MRILAILFCLCCMFGCDGELEAPSVQDRFGLSTPQCEGEGYGVFILTDAATEQQYIVLFTRRGVAITPLLGEMEGE